MQAGTPGGDTTNTPKKMMSKSIRPRVPANMIEPSKEISFGKTIRDMKGRPVPPPMKSKGMMMAGGTKLYNKKGQYQASGELGPERRRRPRIDEDVYTGVRPRAASDSETGMSARERAHNTPQGSSRKNKQGEFQEESTSFSKAFAAARKEGKFTFKWNGKTYGTRRSGESMEQHREAMKKADPAPNIRPTTTPKLKTKEIENTMPEKKLQVSKPAAPSAPASKTSGKVPDRRAAKKTGKETRENVKDQIKGARKQNRGQKAAARKGKRISRLQERLEKLQSKQMGGSMKYKPGGFPDLTGDGKVTRADILKGRGVGKKNRGNR